MPAPPPAFYVENVLEDAILTMTPDGPAADTPIARLVDRDIGLECQDQGTTGTRTWHFDRGVGAATPTVSALILAGSGMAGETFTLESSTDNAAWTSRGTAAPAADAPERFALTPFACPRYVRLTVTDPDVPVNFAELFLAPSLELQWKPSISALREPVLPNVVRVDSASGRTYGVRRGAKKVASTYLMSASPEADRLAVLAALESILDGAKPFWLLTVQSTLRWVRANGAVDFQAADRMLSDWDITIQLEEELA